MSYWQRLEAVYGGVAGVFGPGCVVGCPGRLGESVLKKLASF